jgi:hypothetical protein
MTKYDNMITSKKKGGGSGFLKSKALNSKYNSLFGKMFEILHINMTQAF